MSNWIANYVDAVSGNGTPTAEMLATGITTAIPAGGRDQSCGPDDRGS